MVDIQHAKMNIVLGVHSIWHKHIEIINDSNCTVNVLCEKVQVDLNNPVYIHNETFPQGKSSILVIPDDSVWVTIKCDPSVVYEWFLCKRCLMFKGESIRVINSHQQN